MLAQHVVLDARVAHRPRELLAYHFYNFGFGACRLYNVVPGTKTAEYEQCQYDGRDDRPDNFKRVVIGEKVGLSVLVVAILEREPEHSDEDDGEGKHRDRHRKPEKVVGLLAVFAGY